MTYLYLIVERWLWTITIFVGRGSKTRTLPIRIGQSCLNIAILCQPNDRQ